MIALEQTKNGCGSDQASEAAAIVRSSVSNQGGVEKPGGLFNTSDDPRVGGSVEKPGGLLPPASAERHDVGGCSSSALPPAGKR